MDEKPPPADGHIELMGLAMKGFFGLPWPRKPMAERSKTRSTHGKSKGAKSKLKKRG